MDLDSAAGAGPAEAPTGPGSPPRAAAVGTGADRPRPLSLQDLIDEAVREREEKDKTSWWPTDLGKCLAGAYWRRMGALPDREFADRQLRVFAAGRLFEEFVVRQVAARTEDYETQLRIELPEHDLTGYADLRVGGVLYEVKSVHSRKFWWMQRRREGPDRHALMQLYVGMMALGLPEGRLVYVSKDDLCIVEYPVSLKDQRLREAVLADLEALNRAWRDNVPPEPVPALEGGKLNWRATYCDFHASCTGDPDWRRKAEEAARAVKAAARA
jgi:hypothetical protein